MNSRLGGAPTYLPGRDISPSGSGATYLPPKLTKPDVSSGPTYLTPSQLTKLDVTPIYMKTCLRTSHEQPEEWPRNHWGGARPAIEQQG